MKKRKRREAPLNQQFKLRKIKEINVQTCVQPNWRLQANIDLINNISQGWNEKERRNLHPALYAKQVIYLIYNVYDNRKYIGQTSKSAPERLHEHLQTATRWEKGVQRDHRHNKLYMHMIAIGANNWRIYPIERIPGNFKQIKNVKERIEKFRAVASPKERFWIQNLNSLYPWGLNSILPPEAVNTDSKREVIQEDKGNILNEHKAQKGIAIRIRGHRNWKRRIKHLCNRLRMKALNPMELYRYKFQNLFKMLELIQNINHTELDISVEHAQQLQGLLKGLWRGIT